MHCFVECLQLFGVNLGKAIIYHYCRLTLMRFPLISLSLLLLASCTHPHQPKLHTIERPGYVAIEDKPDHWRVLVLDNNSAESAMMKDFCNPRLYVCQIGARARVILIQRTRK